MSATETNNESTDLVPQKVGEYIVPKTVEALEQLLARTKNSTIPLPFRADILPVPVQRLLYSYGGIPTHVPPNFVSILAGRPYVDADGCIDTAIDQGCNVYLAPSLRVLSCLDPESECPGQRVIKGRNGKPDRVIKAVDGDRSYIATATVVKPSGGRFTESAQCCPHTWAGDAAHRPKMAKTRALRRVTKRALAIPSRAVRADDDPDAIDAEFTETPGGDADAATVREEAAEPRASDSADDGQATKSAIPTGDERSTPSPSSPAPRAEAAPSSSEPQPAASEGAVVPPAAPAEEGVWFWHLFVPPAPGDHAVAAEADQLRTKEQVKTAKRLLEQLNLVPGALDAVFKARYGGVNQAQGTKEQFEAFNDFLEHAELRKNPNIKDEDPPF